MRKWTEKEYFFFKKNENGYFWRGQTWSTLRFTGSPKFIVKSLVNLFWPEKGEQVFDDFMAGMDNIGNTEYPSYRKWDPACFVLYKADSNVNKNKWYKDKKEIPSGEEKHIENGETIVTQDIW